ALAVAGPHHVAATGTGGLPIVDHRVDQIVIETPPRSQRIVLGQIETVRDFGHLAADRNQAVGTQIDVEDVRFAAAAAWPKGLGLGNHNLGASDIENQLGSRWARFVERPMKPMMENSVLILWLRPHLAAVWANDGNAPDLLALRIGGNGQPQIDMDCGRWQ